MLTENEIITILDSLKLSLSILRLTQNDTTKEREMEDLIRKVDDLESSDSDN